MENRKIISLGMFLSVDCSVLALLYSLFQNSCRLQKTLIQLVCIFGRQFRGKRKTEKIVNGLENKKLVIGQKFIKTDHDIPKDTAGPIFLFETFQRY